MKPVRVLLLLMLTAALTAAARSYKKPKPEESAALTLEDCVRYALKKNSTILKAGKDVDIAAIRLLQSVNVYLPSLKAGINYTRLDEEQTFTQQMVTKYIVAGKSVDDGLSRPPYTPTGQGTVFGEAYPDPNSIQTIEGSMNKLHDFQGTLTLTQPLFMWAWITAPMLSFSGMDMAKNGYTFARANVVGAVKRSFYGCLIARESVELQKESIRQATLQEKITRDKFNVGQASKYELLTAKVRLENLVPNLYNAEKNYKNSLLSLKNIMRFPLNRTLDLKGDIRPKFKGYVMEDLHQFAKKNSYQLKIIRSTKDLKNATHLAGFSGMMPSAIFNFQYSMNLNESLYPAFVGETYDYSPAFGEDRDTSWAATVGISVPISEAFLPWSKTWTDVFAAQVEKEKTEIDEKDELDKTRINIETILFSLRQARKSVESAQKTIESAKEGLEITQKRYKNGQASDLDLLNAEINLNQSKTNLLRAQADYIFSQIDLEILIGQVEEVK